MNTLIQDDAIELRLSAKPVLLLVSVLGYALLLTTESLLDEVQLPRLLYLGVAVIVLSVPIWFIDGSRPKLGRMLTLLLLEAAVSYGYIVLHMQGFLVLLPIVPALAVAMVGVKGAIALAVSETLLVILAQRYLTMSPEGVVAALLAVISIWSIVTLMARLVEHLARVNQWAQDYLRLAHDLIGEQRDRRAELAQMMADLREANRQLTRVNVLAHGLRRAAEEARLAKERFVANVSHELRTPLNMIIGFSRLILEMPKAYGDSIPAALLADLSVIHRNAEHLSGLVDDVLDLSQIETKHLALTKEDVHLPDILDAAIVATRPLYQSKALYVHVEIEDDLPPVCCDGIRIREVMLNLLSNAGRFTDVGGVTVRAWLERNDIVVSVTDTGPGIAKIDEHKVFAPFQQLDDSMRRRHGGTGLGLNISRSLVELHGGQMWFESEPQSGSTFFFRLPTGTRPDETTDVAKWFGPYMHYEERTRPSLAGAPTLLPRAAVIDPSGTLQRLLSRYLEGFEVISVPGFVEAAQDIAEQPTTMLLINDLATQVELREMNAVALPYGTPVVSCLIAGASDSIKTLGVQEYLVKPVSREAMLATLDALELQEGTILIVDDEPEATRLFRRMLISSGRPYRVLRAEDGDQALRILRAEAVDAIMMDLIMPNVDGFQLLEQKHADMELRDIPVVVISARDPTGQPIISSGLSIRREGGLSAPELLRCIREISRLLSPLGEQDDRVLEAGQRD